MLTAAESSKAVKHHTDHLICSSSPAITQFSFSSSSPPPPSSSFTGTHFYILVTIKSWTRQEIIIHPQRHSVFAQKYFYCWMKTIDLQLSKELSLTIRSQILFLKYSREDQSGGPTDPITYFRELDLFVIWA